MADLGEDFRPDEIPEDDRSFDPVPPGDYLCQVVESDVVPTKDKQGDILKLTIEIIEGSFSNRKVFENLNIRNPSAEAQRIAQRALADLCLAVGVGAIRNSEELHFKPFIAKLKIQPAKDGYDAKNKVSRYRPRGGQAPHTTAAPAPQAARPSGPPPSAAPAQPRPTGAQNAPWRRPAATATAQ